MSLIFHTVEYLAVVPDDLAPEYQRTWMIRKYQKQVNLYDIVSYTWEALLNELLRQELWAENFPEILPR